MDAVNRDVKTVGLERKMVDDGGEKRSITIATSADEGTSRRKIRRRKQHRTHYHNYA